MSAQPTQKVNIKFRAEIGAKFWDVKLEISLCGDRALMLKLYDLMKLSRLESNLHDLHVK